MSARAPIVPTRLSFMISSLRPLGRQEKSASALSARPSRCSPQVATIQATTTATARSSGPHSQPEAKPTPAPKAPIKSPASGKAAMARAMLASFIGGSPGTGTAVRNRSASPTGCNGPQRLAMPSLSRLSGTDYRGLLSSGGTSLTARTIVAEGYRSRLVIPPRSIRNCQRFSNGTPSTAHRSNRIGVAWVTTRIRRRRAG